MGQQASACWTVLRCQVWAASRSCEHQERDLVAFAQRVGYEMVDTNKETDAGVRLDRAERRKVPGLSQRREIGVVMARELSR